MSLSDTYQLNSKDIVSDLVEDEVIIVDLISGSYYSLEGVGALVWTCLERGMDVGATVRSVAAVYDGSDAEITAIVEGLVGELSAAKLISAAGLDNGQLSAPPPPAPAPAPSMDKKPLVTPVLNKYTDMQELILIDPVHDVDEQGWPVLKQEKPQ